MRPFWPLLAPFSLLYSGIVSTRNTLYNRGYLKSYQTRSAVLSIGNITAGGSGKSPLTQALASSLQALAPDLPVVVVSRGYGRRTRGPQIVSDGTEVLLTPDLGGDEPVMLAHALGTVPVVVSEKRVEGVALAEERFGARLIVLDDAFQHRRIQRDLDIVLVDASEPDWIWRPLPAGRLRENPSALSRANLVILTGEAEEGRRQQLGRFVKELSDAPLLEGTARLAQIRRHEDGEILPLDELKGKRVALACGIARPERFIRAIESLGAEIVVQTTWRDHAWTTRPQRDSLMKRAAEGGAEVVVITAKDAVKWPRGETGLPVWVPELRWEWADSGSKMGAQLEGFVEAARRRLILQQ